MLQCLIISPWNLSTTVIVFFAFVNLPSNTWRESATVVFALNGLPQRSKLPPVIIDKDNLTLDPVHRGLESACVGFAAQDKNLMTTLAGPLAHIELVTVCPRRERDVAGSQEENPVALAAFAEVQGTGTLEVRSGSGSDLDNSEWVT
jgi:hypothetical protein